MEDLKAIIFFDARTSDPDVLRSTLEAIESIDVISPQYWGICETKRNPWDRDAVMAYCARRKQAYKSFFYTTVEFWHTRAPRHTALLGVSDQSVNDFEFYAPPPPAKHLKAFYEAVGALVEKLPTLFAYVHPMWAPGPLAEGVAEASLLAYNANGRAVNVTALAKFGLPGVYARTWVGAKYVQRVGRDLLLSLVDATETPSGNIHFDLVHEPWKAGPRELVLGRQQAMDRVRPSGMFGEYFLEAGVSSRRSPAPKWTIPDWGIPQEYLDAAQ